MLLNKISWWPFKNKEDLSEMAELMAERAELIGAREHISFQQTQINLLKDLIDALLEEINLLKKKARGKSQKKKYFLVDAISEIFHKSQEELNASQVIKQLRWERKKVKKPTVERINAILHYMVKTNKLSKGKKRGKFIRRANHE